VLQGTPGAVREVDALLQQLEPTLPVLLANAITLNQVVVTHLSGVEQLLVEFPVPSRLASPAPPATAGAM
jgi:phospholipid/cholesterol/gamma-HCH transport system substrate-binding protein